ncbi:CCA tRNA nucleotidyltransferase [Ureibacillus sp. FSL K6-8385]|uniref:CCA-adding enzyme n=1 Tax=Ureibacillus terrenus TaxID=118246 RepID=A0A540V6G7_9BACL|nr:CCA tRNA nucleotidyltransferase [Ureibacillus terrenus]MED3660651.1 CCA tRNA nucleotidyltransferase [Ureibacillus terrenus]MED3762771.1 CCA tRNA nucleotidyltransferase [Ureibacillus terrenus]TQE92357.1 CCA tRNA nucleotidyltransferase [Ureibacillus terrenus]
MKQRNDWEAALRVIEKIENAGYEAVIVGGAVRDYLLQRKINDVDVATSALPNEVKKIFSHTIDVGIEHGTVVVLDEGSPIEVTTYRTEGTYTDYRRPDEVTFVRDLPKDLERRDFTINAMAFTKDGNIVDLYGGKEDLKNGIIRAVGDPNARFREDALRMLRAVRFAAQLGFTIEEKTMKAIQEDSDLIEFIARERIRMELSKIWVADYVFLGIEALVESNLASYLPGNFAKHLESWRHFRTKKPEVGWAYLCLLNRSDMEDLFEFYRYSNKEKSFAKKVIHAYDRLLERWDEYDYFSNDLNTLETAYDFAHWLGKKVPFSKEHIGKVKEHLPIQSMDDFALNGNLLIQWSGKRGGPWVKEALNKALHAVLTGQVKNDEEQLKEWFYNEFVNER